MLMPHPATLRKLVEQYESLVAQQAERGAAKPDQRTQDLEYTLCVSTGTRDVRSALEKARRHLAASQQPGPVLRMPQRPTATPVADNIRDTRDTRDIRDTRDTRGAGEAVA